MSKNLNFSVYIDQKDNTPPRKDFLENEMNKIYPKNNIEWVDSDKVLNCQICSNVFSFFITLILLGIWFLLNIL